MNFVVKRVAFLHTNLELQDKIESLDNLQNYDNIQQTDREIFS